jgi:hypothetical protein
MSVPKAPVKQGAEEESKTTGGATLAAPAFQLTAGPEAKSLEAGGNPTSEVTPFPWSVTSDGTTITFMLGEGKAQQSETHDVKAVRDFVLKNYNWNGMVVLMTQMDALFDDFTYTRPSDLVGNATDNTKILPDKGIECLIKAQAKYAIETTYKANPAANIAKIRAAVDGEPMNDIAKSMGTTRDALLDESDNTNMKSGETDIVVPDLATAGETKLYDFLQSLVLARNGLWSSTNHITNITSIRRVLETSKTKYNDTMFVSWKDGEAKHVKQYVGSTEPGDLAVGQMLPQTTTIASGFHTGGSSGTPGGRTRNAYRKSKKDDSKYFQSGDTSMNVHFGHPDIENVPLDYGVGRNDDGAGEYDANQVAAHATLIELMHILTQWGDTKTGLSAYRNLEIWHKDFTRGEVSTTTTGDKQVTISDGEKTGGKSSTLSYSSYTAFVDSQYDGKVKGKASTTEETKDKASAVGILTYHYNQTGNGAEVAGLSGKTLAELRTLLKTEAVWLATVDMQMKNEGNPVDKAKVDGRPQEATVTKMGLDAATMTTQTEDFTTKKAKADTDWARTGVLFEGWDKNPKLKNNATLKTTLKESIKLDASNSDQSKAKDVDNKGGKGMDKTVGGWSEGCQIVLGGKNFYDFMYNATQYATETAQQRWYYTIIDIDSLGSDVKKGPPVKTTEGSK